MTGAIPFARESWIAVNLYAMRTDGRQTLTLDGVPPPDYDPQRAVDYLDRYEAGPHELGIGGTFYCIMICAPVLGLGLWESGGAWLLLVASLELDR